MIYNLFTRFVDCKQPARQLVHYTDLFKKFLSEKDLESQPFKKSWNVLKGRW